ncbi:baseplate assembly protein [Mangrovibacter sp. MFB070]|nr:baseplate assembly protein [Mangrovibacter sp. MFB070]
MFGIGRVTGQDDSGTAQKIQYQTPLEVASAHRLLDFGFSSGLPVGSDVVIAFVGGDRSSPVVIASGHQSYRHTGLNPGETVIYNQWGLSILLTESGITIEAAGQDVTINNANNLTATATGMAKFITPKLLCTGDIIDNCNSNSVTLKQLRDAYNLHDHEVKEVQAGSSAVTSEKTGSPVDG